MLPDSDLSCTLTDLMIIHHNKPMATFDRHHHDGPECIIPLFGSLTLDFPEVPQQLTVKPGQMIFIPQSVPHSAVSEERFGERLLLLLKPGLVDVSRIAITYKSQLLVELCFEIFVDEDPEFRERAMYLIHRFLRKKLSQEEPQVIDTKSLVAMAADERIKKTLYLFEKSPETDLKMGELATMAGLSERSMQRLFKTELGMTPNAVLAVYRIEKAIRLLRAGDSVTQTAYAVGYASLSQFIAQFRTLTGRIPSDYRG